MGLIEFVKGFRKKENSKVSAKRRIAEFRGLTTDCTSEQLIKEFKKFPRVTFPETLGLTELVTKKGDLFSFELLNKDFEAGAEILSRCHAAEPFLKLHKRWLIDTGNLVPNYQVNKMITKRIEQSNAVTNLISNVLEGQKDYSKWFVYPSAANVHLEMGEFYQVTMYDTYDKEFLEPMVSQIEYTGGAYQEWDTPKGMRVIAWRNLPEAYVPNIIKK